MGVPKNVSNSVYLSCGPPTFVGCVGAHGLVGVVASMWNSNEVYVALFGPKRVPCGLIRRHAIAESVRVIPAAAT